jgi:hypothetical protein
MKVDIEKSPTAAAVGLVVLLLGAAASALGGVVSLYHFALTPPGLATITVGGFLLLLFLVVRSALLGSQSGERR